MLLDLVMAAELQPELVQIDDAVWAHLKMTMDTLLIQIRDHSQPGHADTLVPLQSSANRLMLLVRLMHDRPMSRKPSPDADDIDLARAAAAADTALAAERLARHDTIRQWLQSVLVLRKDLQARSLTVHLDELPSAYVELQLTQLQTGLACLSAPPPLSMAAASHEWQEGKTAEWQRRIIAGAGEDDEEGRMAATMAAEASAARAASTAAAMLSFAKLPLDERALGAVHMLGGVFIDRLDRAQSEALYHPIAMAQTYALRAQCQLGALIGSAVLPDAQREAMVIVTKQLQTLQDALLDPAFIAAHLVGKKWTTGGGDGVDKPLDDRVGGGVGAARSPRSVLAPQRCLGAAGSCAALLGELLLGEAFSSDRQACPKLLSVLLKGSGMHDEGPSLVGLLQLLEYGESTAGAAASH